MSHAVVLRIDNHMRPSVLLMILFAGIACRGKSSRSELSKAAEEFFSATAAGDSGRVSTLIADTLVLRDIEVLSANAPGLMTEAAAGLKIERGGSVSADSAYLFFHPATSQTRRGLGIGFVRERGTWLIYYVGLTGPDVTGAPRPR